MPDLAEATDRINSLSDRSPRGRSWSVTGTRGARVGILGLSYKPETAVIEESQGVGLAAQLADQGYARAVYDPLALPAALAVLGSKACAPRRPKRCVRRRCRGDRDRMAGVQSRFHAARSLAAGSRVGDRLLAPLPPGTSSSGRRRWSTSATETISPPPAAAALCRPGGSM